MCGGLVGLRRQRLEHRSWRAGYCAEENSRGGSHLSSVQELQMWRWSIFSGFFPFRFCFCFSYFSGIFLALAFCFLQAETQWDFFTITCHTAGWPQRLINPSLKSHGNRCWIYTTPLSCLEGVFLIWACLLSFLLLCLLVLCLNFTVASWWVSALIGCHSIISRIFLTG